MYCLTNKEDIATVADALEAFIEDDLESYQNSYYPQLVDIDGQVMVQVEDNVFIHEDEINDEVYAKLLEKTTWKGE